MFLVRVEVEGAVREGWFHADRVELVSGSIAAGFQSTGEWVSAGDCRFLAPVQPGKVVAVARNYAEHAAELGNTVSEEPLIFIKPSTAVIGPGEAIRVPPGCGRVDYEGELAVVIGRRARKVSEAEAAAHIFGFTCLNDVTAREIQQKEKHFSRAKGLDSFCPIGPHILCSNSLEERTIITRVNGQVRQEGGTSLMVHPISKLIAFISRYMTLEPGDVIATGTPKGVGPLQPGDLVTVEISGIGVLENPVVADAD
jgi:2-keto-4-pentenoate hydratase/2-oxohepta-3-ene-1,7-dioic acid hydratase in catechol pathway